MEKPRLLPVGVPWRIDSATPFMRVFASGEEIGVGVPWISSLSEVLSQARNPTTGIRETLFATFVGYFGTEDKGPSREFPHPDPPVVVTSPGEFNAHAPKSEGAYRMIRLTFYEVADTTVFRAGSDYVLEQLYDLSAIGDHAQGTHNWKQYRRRIWRSWRDTGLCPDPRMYEVENSPHVVRLRSENPHWNKFKHYLLIGNDVNVEVVAARWIWEEGQTLAGW